MEGKEILEIQKIDDLARMSDYGPRTLDFIPLLAAKTLEILWSWELETCIMNII